MAGSLHDRTHHMAMVVSISAIVTQETHGISLSDVLRVSLHKLLGAIPQSWNGFHIFVQAQHKTVFLLVVRHKFEGIVVNVAI